MADALLIIRHASVDDESEEQPIEDNRRARLVSVHGPKSPELLEEIREQKFQKQRLTGRLTHIDPVASLQGRFSFLRRGKKPAANNNTSPPITTTITTMEIPAMYPRRQTAKDFEFDMEQEIEDEKERLAKLPPGGENIWA